MELSFPKVRHIFIRFVEVGVFSFVVLWTCILPTIYAAPTSTCPPNTGLDKVGFCIPSLNGTYSYIIWDCMKCPPGLGLSVECGKVYDKVMKVECQPCKKGTFSENNDFRQCKPCSHCPEYEVQSGECKTDKDTIRCTGICKTGYYKAQGMCKPCSWCCGDKTNEYVDECRNMPKECSFQDVKSCGPTTAPAPTNVSTSVSTTSTSTTQESLSTPAPTEITTPRASSKRYSSTKEIMNDADEKNSSEEKESVAIPIIIVLSVIIIIVLVLVLVCYFRRRSGKSSCDNSAQVSRSTSTSNELNSSVPLISGAEEKKNSTIHICSKNTVAYDKGAEEAAFLTTSGDQEKLLGHPAEGNIAGRDSPSINTSLESPTCSCTVALDIQDNTENHTESTIGQLSSSCDVSSVATGGSVSMDVPNVKLDGKENAGQLTKKEKLDLPVTEIPLQFYCKVCALLDREDHFFCDYRMVAEKIGVSKEQTHALKKPPTNSLLMEHKPKVRELMEILERMKREDVMEVVEEWLSQE